MVQSTTERKTQATRWRMNPTCVPKSVRATSPDLNDNLQKWPKISNTLLKLLQNAKILSIANCMLACMLTNWYRTTSFSISDAMNVRLVRLIAPFPPSHTSHLAVVCCWKWECRFRCFEGKTGGILHVGAWKRDQSWKKVYCYGAVRLSSLPRVVKITVTYQ